LTVRTALHIRTGQPATGAALEGWLARHTVDVVGCDDVYEACVRLLQNYDAVPDLVLLGADWLNADEYRIVRYVRETWPRAGILIYGRIEPSPAWHATPMLHVCHTPGALDKLIAATPAQLLQRLCADTAPLGLGAARPPAPAPTLPRDRQEPCTVTSVAAAPEPTAAATRNAARALLTPEELSALLNPSAES
jgi:hypothetical protein